MSGSAAASIIAFAVVAATLVVTPGVGTAFLISTVVDRGRRAGYLTAGGMVVGALFHATVAAVGSAMLLRVFPGALRFIALAGGTFIVALGIRSAVRALRSRSTMTSAASASDDHHATVTTGFLIALGNAPLPLFYFVIVPRYVPPGMSRLAGVALLSAIHILMAGSWMTTLVTLLGRLAPLLRKRSIQLTLQLASAGILVVLGGQAILGAI